jgi:hypothetical protein
MQFVFFKRLACDLPRFANAAVLFFAATFLFATFVFPQKALAAAPSCPPGTNVNIAESAILKNKLKAKLARDGVPERIRALVDKLPNCRKCIEAVKKVKIVTVVDREVGLELERRNGPINGLSTEIVGNYMYRSGDWSPKNEQIARTLMEQGTAVAMHITLLDGPCSCCPEDEISARSWQEAGGALRDSETLFNNEVSISINDPARLGPLPRDLYELEESLTAKAIDGDIEGSDRLPPDYPPILRIAQAFCPECRNLAEQRNALVRQYNDLREMAVAQRKEGSRRLREHVSQEGESVRRRQLINSPGETDTEAGYRRDLSRTRADNARLEKANATLAQARAKRAKLEELAKQIDILDKTLLDCDQVPCRVEATNTPAPVVNETSAELAPDRRVQQTFAAFLGLAFKNSVMASGVDYISGGLSANGSTAVHSAAFSFGLMAYPFSGLPVYVSAEGMIFAGGDGNFYTASFHPGPGGDTTAKGRPQWAGRVSVGVTVPFEGGCVNRSTCFLVDVDGGVIFEKFRTTFVTDESGGGGQRNVFAFDHTHAGISLGAALSIPLCSLVDVTCGLALAPYGRMNFFPGATESFRVNTSAFNLAYAGDFDIRTQAEIGMRLVMPFGGGNRR